MPVSAAAATAAPPPYFLAQQYACIQGPSYSVPLPACMQRCGALLPQDATLNVARLWTATHWPRHGAKLLTLWHAERQQRSGGAVAAMMLVSLMVEYDAVPPAGPAAAAVAAIAAAAGAAGGGALTRALPRYFAPQLHPQVWR
eukprot:107665-Chlamydomonas_euryale.AAC.2